MDEKGDATSYLTDSSPARCPSEEGVEKEQPAFHRLDRYPTVPGNDRDGWKLSSGASTVCCDELGPTSLGELAVSSRLKLSSSCLTLPPSCSKLKSPWSERAGEFGLTSANMFWFGEWSFELMLGEVL